MLKPHIGEYILCRIQLWVRGSQKQLKRGTFDEEIDIDGIHFQSA